METKTEKRVSLSGVMVKSVIGGAVSLAASLILLLLFALLLDSELLPESIGEELVITAVFIAAVFGGLLAAKRNALSPMPGGICGGVCFLIIILLITALRPDSQVFSVMTIKLLICALSGGAFGGLLAGKRKFSKKRKKRR